MKIDFCGTAIAKKGNDRHIRFGWSLKLWINSSRHYEIGWNY